MKRQLTPDELAYLTDDQTAEDANVWCLRNGMPSFFGNINPCDLWEQNRDDFLPAFIGKNPGRRPTPWWQWDSPRHDTGTGAWFEPLPIPRQRIGGIGTPKHEVLSYVPQFDRGIPTGWVSKFDENYYNGRMVDIHGKIIPTKYKEGDFQGVAIDSEDPPTFESEAAYLDRYGLLSETEKRWLEKHPELMGPEVVTNDDE
jgi:hypothetical protein